MREEEEWGGALKRMGKKGGTECKGGGRMTKRVGGRGKGEEREGNRKM